MSHPLVSQKLQAGIAEKRAGNFALALKFYKEAGDIDPTDLDVYGNSATVYAGMLDTDACLRNILTRQHLAELLTPCSASELNSVLYLYKWSNINALKPTVQLEQVLDILNSNSPRKAMFRNILHDYRYTRMAGVLSLKQPCNKEIAQALRLTPSQIEKMFENYRGSSGGTTFQFYDNSIDPAIALMGLNLISQNRILLEKEVALNSLEISKRYFISKFEINWVLPFASSSALQRLFDFLRRKP